jgi:hypothetical protein
VKRYRIGAAGAVLDLAGQDYHDRRKKEIVTVVVRVILMNCMPAPKKTVGDIEDIESEC